MTDANAKSLASGPLAADTTDLERKKKDLDEVSAQLTDAQKRQAQINDEIKILEARVLETQKMTDAYVSVAVAQQDTLEQRRKSIAQKSVMALAGIKEQKDEVDKIVQSTDSDIKKGADNVTASQKACDKATQDWDSARADVQKKQDAYTALKQLQKDIDLQLKQASDLLTQAAKSESAGEVASMYFLVSEAGKIAGPESDNPITILTPEVYAERARNAQAGLDEAKAKLARQKVALDQKAKELNDNQSDLSAKRTARQSTILARLKDLKVTSPASSAAIISVASLPKSVVAPASTANAGAVGG